VEPPWLLLDASASTQGPALHVENWFPCWRSWPGRIGEELEAQGFASPSIMVVGEVVAQRVEACAPEPADAELPIPF
jgi:siroheme synthase